MGEAFNRLFIKRKSCLYFVILQEIPEKYFTLWYIAKCSAVRFLPAAAAAAAAAAAEVLPADLQPQIGVRFKHVNIKISHFLVLFSLWNALQRAKTIFFSKKIFSEFFWHKKVSLISYMMILLLFCKKFDFAQKSKKIVKKAKKKCFFFSVPFF